MELKDLAGVRHLTGVDFLGNGNDTDANTCRFRLDGVIYIAEEDEEDGYRSSMGELGIVFRAEMNNMFAPVKVNCVYSSKDPDTINGDTQDILYISDFETNATILEVGTDNMDDYYPYYVAMFYPDNMAINQFVKPVRNRKISFK